ncbi:uncharacterized protein LOC134833638 [Culicoides brevitarsis]|uniref:uncharacterized protein LOC134833638 n=1 Tax=Culicoides brevitarsis TaxID=469753 RepID=UPI00307B37C5
MKLSFNLVVILAILLQANYARSQKTSKLNDTDSPSKISLSASFDEKTSTTSKTTTLSTKSSTKKSTLRKSSSLRTTTTTKIPAKIEANEQLECPKDNEAPFQLFFTSCTSHKECKSLGPNNLCCKLFGSKRCIEGKIPQPKEPKHEPILFVIPRKCPKPGQILAETWWNIETCETDADCWPRICCPDGKFKYCRTSQPEFESSSNPIARQLASPLESVSQYLQCTPPPPPVFDPHPKTCNNTLDCFPNLCCAEAGKRHCRPPRRSILSLLTGFAQGFSNVSFIRDWSENLVIK